MNRLISFGEGGTGTVQGASHRRAGRDCEDYSGSEYVPELDCLLFAAADGHGNRAYARSATGSRMAVEVALFQLRKLASEIASPSDVSRENWGEEIRTQRERAPVLRSMAEGIVGTWEDYVRRHYARAGLTPEEKDDMGDHGMQLIGDRLTRLYGTTLIAGALLPDLLILLQQGDGLGVTLLDDGSVGLPLGEDELCQANVTTSLCDSDAAQRMRFAVIDRSECDPVACFVVTDGVDNSLRRDGGVEDFFCEVTLSALGASDESAAREWLKETLNDVSEHGVGDDSSLAGYVNVERAEAARKALEQRRAAFAAVLEREEREQREAELQRREREQAEVTRLQNERDELRQDHERKRLDLERQRRELDRQIQDLDHETMVYDASLEQEIRAREARIGLDGGNRQKRREPIDPVGQDVSPRPPDAGQVTMQMGAGVDTRTAVVLPADAVGQFAETRAHGDLGPTPTVPAYQPSTGGSEAMPLMPRVEQSVILTPGKASTAAPAVDDMPGSWEGTEATTVVPDVDGPEVQRRQGRSAMEGREDYVPAAQASRKSGRRGGNRRARGGRGSTMALVGGVAAACAGLVVAMVLVVPRLGSTDSTMEQAASKSYDSGSSASLRSGESNVEDSSGSQADSSSQYHEMNETKIRIRVVQTTQTELRRILVGLQDDTNQIDSSYMQWLLDDTQISEHMPKLDQGRVSELAHACFESVCLQKIPTDRVWVSEDEGVIEANVAVPYSYLEVDSSGGEDVTNGDDFLDFIIYRLGESTNSSASKGVEDNSGGSPEGENVHPNSTNEAESEPDEDVGTELADGAGEHLNSTNEAESEPDEDVGTESTDVADADTNVEPRTGTTGNVSKSAVVYVTIRSSDGGQTWIVDENSKRDFVHELGTKTGFFDVCRRAAELEEDDEVDFSG